MNRDLIIVAIGGVALTLLLLRAGVWLWRTSHRSGNHREHSPHGLQNLWDGAHQGDFIDGDGDDGHGGH